MSGGEKERTKVVERGESETVKKKQNSGRCPTN